MRSINAWLYVFFFGRPSSMDYLQALGQILRELRVSRGLTREACGEVISPDHLAKVEQGRQALTLPKFNALCGLFDVPPSQVLFALEARLASAPIDEYQQQWQEHLRDALIEGRLHGDVQKAAARGVRGKRADETGTAVRELQAQGMRKMDVVRQLKIGRSTVDRYWLET